MTRRTTSIHPYQLCFVLPILFFAGQVNVCLAEEPQIYQARVNICSLIDSGKYTDAASATDNLLSNFSGNQGLPEALYWIAERYERYDKFDEASWLYQQVTQNYPNNDWANKSTLAIARVNIKLLITSGKYDSAKTAIEKFSSDFKNNSDLPEALFWITERFQRADRLEDAKIYFQRIVNNYPDSPWANKAKFWCSRVTILSLVSNQQFGQAGDAIDKFVSDFKDNAALPEALFWIAERFQRSERFEEARQTFQRVIDNYPTSPWADKAKFWVSRVTVFSMIISQDYDGAKSALDKFMANFAGDSDYPETLYWIAERYERLDKFDEANRVYTELSQKFPTNPWTDKAKPGVSRANVTALIVSEKYDDAKEALNKLIADFSNHPRLPGTLYWIAERYQRQNRFEEANRLYKQISANYPDNSYAQKAQFDIRTTDIHILIEANEVNQADSAIDKFIMDFKNHPRLHDKIYYFGEIYCNRADDYKNQELNEQEKENFRKAVSVWDKIITKTPPSEIYTPQAYYAVASCYSNLGDYNTAISYHKKVIADYPNFEKRYMAMFMLVDCYNKQASCGQISQQDTKEQIISIYREIIDQYPECNIACIVRTNLIHLGAELP
jgi:TolA-binding protein